MANALRSQAHQLGHQRAVLLKRGGIGPLENNKGGHQRARQDKDSHSKSNNRGRGGFHCARL